MSDAFTEVDAVVNQVDAVVNRDCARMLSRKMQKYAGGFLLLTRFGFPSDRILSLYMQEAKLCLKVEAPSDQLSVPATGQASELTRLEKARPLSWQD